MIQAIVLGTHYFLPNKERSWVFGIQASVAKILQNPVHSPVSGGLLETHSAVVLTIATISHPIGGDEESFQRSVHLGSFGCNTS